MQSLETKCEDNDKMDIDQSYQETLYTEEQIKNRAEAFMVALELIRGDGPDKEI